MKFCENFLNQFIKYDIFPPTFKITWYAKNCVYIEGAKNLFSIKSEEIIVVINGGNLVLKGKGLYVASYGEQDLLICGKINEIKSIDKGDKWKGEI